MMIIHKVWLTSSKDLGHWKWYKMEEENGAHKYGRYGLKKKA